MSEQEKVVTIKIYTSEPAQMRIIYKDKHDLFRKFKKNLRKLDFPTDEIYWFDWENMHTRIRTADDVYIAVMEGSAKMFARDPKNQQTFPTFSSDDEEEEEGRNVESRESEEVPRRNTARNSSPSPVRARGRSKSEPRRGNRPYFDLYSYYPWNYSQWMDPPYNPCLDYYYNPYKEENRRASDKNCRCQGNKN